MSKIDAESLSAEQFSPDPDDTEAPLAIMLGRRLQRLRLERDLSVQLVAAGTGFSVERVREHEAGAVRINARELIIYVVFFAVSIGAFFYDSPA